MSSTLLGNAVEQAIARAKAKALADAEAAAKAEQDAQASKVEAWKQHIAERAAKERETRDKSGMAIAEEFLREIAEPFTRLMARDDAAKLASYKIIMRPGKSDASPAYSMVIECSGMSPRIWHRASIDQLMGQQQTQLSKLQAKGGFISSSPVELMEEIIKLRDYIARVGKVVDNIQTPEDADAAPGKVRDILAPLQLASTSVEED